MRLAPASLESAIYVMIQFACLITFFLGIRLIPDSIFIIFGIALFLFIGIWAIFIMKFNFNIAPEPVSNAKLIVKGPYRFIRHPMYTSVLGISLCYLIQDYSIFKLMIYVILTVNFIMKLNYEEKILSKRFSEYNEYKKRTKMLIPYLF